MATAKKELADFKVVLTLTREEAEVLYDITYKIGGDPRTSPRKHVDAIGTALRGLGINRTATPLSGGLAYVSYASEVE